MSSTNRGSEREPSDFYTTPSWATRAILRVLGPHAPESVLEPGCGDGAILKVLAEVWPKSSLLGIEIDQDRVTEARRIAQCRQADFLTLHFDPPAFGMALGNPPFSLAIEFAERCFSFARETVLLMRLAMLEGKKRTAWWRQHPADVLVLPRRPSFTGKGTDSSAYAWFVWAPGRGGRWSVLDVE